VQIVDSPVSRCRHVGAGAFRLLTFCLFRRRSVKRREALSLLMLCVPFCVTTGVVKAEQIWREAEIASSMTAPLLIMNDAAASGGQYITVAGGNNSSATPPIDWCGKVQHKSQGWMSL
jgi:hypothetical protein